MNQYAVLIEQLHPRFDEKKSKKLKIKIFINLCNKLDGSEDDEILGLVTESYDLLRALSVDDAIKPKQYLKSFARLQKTTRNKLGYTEKDQIKNEYLAIGMAIGIAIGSAFITINSGAIAIGLPIGLAIGISIGNKKEKEAADQGKIY